MYQTSSRPSMAVSSTVSGRRRLPAREWKIGGTSRPGTSSRMQLAGLRQPTGGRKKSIGGESQRGLVRRPRTGLTTASPGSGSQGNRLFSLRNTSSGSLGGSLGGTTSRLGTASLAGKIRSRDTGRGSTSASNSGQGSEPSPLLPEPGLMATQIIRPVQAEPAVMARRGTLWQTQALNKPSTSSAACRATRGAQLNSLLPAVPIGAALGGNVKLETASCSLPHPGKANGGEDAHFFLDHAVGVADGVGGWSAHGIDAGEYARQLMRFMEAAVQAGTTDPVEAMWLGYHQTDTLGSSTCLLLVLDPGNHTIESANLGDSAFRHIRDSAVCTRAKVGQHYFNCPYQLGSHSGDMPSDSLRQITKVLVGDFCVCGSDGLFDNLFDSEIIGALDEYREDLNAAASAIAHLAQRAATNMHRQGPFAQEANASGIAFQGGKLDDITCVVSKVVAQ